MSGAHDHWLTYEFVVKVLGVLFAALAIIACLRIATLKPAHLRRSRLIKLGIVALPAAAVYKLLAFGGIVAAPAATTFLAHYNTFERTHEVQACNSCHVMTPMVTDMLDPASQTLAARHYRNGWIAENQCYHCHSDYGLNGSLEAKMTGFRHLARYTTSTYTEPIKYRGDYVNGNCLNCHRGTPKFLAIDSHSAGWDRLQNNQMSCLNCHGYAHPTRSERTPGSADYSRLMVGRTEP